MFSLGMGGLTFELGDVGVSPTSLSISATNNIVLEEPFFWIGGDNRDGEPTDFQASLALTATFEKSIELEGFGEGAGLAFEFSGGETLPSLNYPPCNLLSALSQPP